MRAGIFKHIDLSVFLTAGPRAGPLYFLFRNVTPMGFSVVCVRLVSLSFGAHDRAVSGPHQRRSTNEVSYLSAKP